MSNPFATLYSNSVPRVEKHEEVRVERKAEKSATNKALKVVSEKKSESTIERCADPLEILKSLAEMKSEDVVVKPPVIEEYKPKKKKETKVNNIIPIQLAKETKTEEVKEEKEIKSGDGYKKFEKMFSDYRKSQPEGHRKGFELSHKIILEHIKSITETSDEYNKNLMHPCKTSRDMILYVMEKCYENAEEIMFSDAEDRNAFICGAVDEYVGKTDDVKKWESEKKKKEEAEAKKKKDREELEAEALKNIEDTDDYKNASDEDKKKKISAEADRLKIEKLKGNKK